MTDLTDFATEINEWAVVTHTEVIAERTKPRGGIYIAYDGDTAEEAGRLSYYYINDSTIMFQEVRVTEDYRRRKVATALLRVMHMDNPGYQINPGSRNAAGQGFYDYILNYEPEIVAKTGVFNVPLSTMLPPGFRPGQFAERMAGTS